MRLFPSLEASLKFEKDGRVKVDIEADVSDDLLAAIKAGGGEVFGSFPEDHVINACLPLESVESLAARNELDLFGRQSARSQTPEVLIPREMLHIALIWRVPTAQPDSESRWPCFPIASMTHTALSRPRK